MHPDAFHVSLLFQPTLAFMDRTAEVLPFGHEASRESTFLLEDFVLKVYLPQLEDKVSLLFHQSVSGKWFVSAPSVACLNSCQARMLFNQTLLLIN